MTTTNGVPKPKQIRHAVAVLEERRAYLTMKQVEYEAEHGHVSGFLEDEIRALDLAIPALDSEADFCSRFWQAQNRLDNDRRWEPMHEDVVAAGQPRHPSRFRPEGILAP